ncbi:MAG TPA: pyridoxamine 5'-phosphate oxidase [Gemmatimonadaceae bacterium]|nr:pyridoxamine 5'-phosphate oxidase [Gemmatimonadaceae bacterium]
MPLPDLDPRVDDRTLDPFERFALLLDAAQRLDRALLPEPTAFALATVSPDGMPTARIMLLKAVEDESFVFYTNYESRKGGELAAAGRAGICFHWQHLERQVRAHGPVERVPAEEADAYFASRPRGSQLGAWASQQSRPMPHDGALEERLAAFERRFAGGDVPRPPHWGGWRLRPTEIEFWRNMPSRLHVRHRYTREGSGWTVQRLYP